MCEEPPYSAFAGMLVTPAGGASSSKKKLMTLTSCANLYKL